MRGSEYWNYNLEKIQYALKYLRRVKEEPNGIDSLLSFLERQEDKAVKDLIEAEQAEEGDQEYE